MSEFTVCPVGLKGNSDPHWSHQRLGCGLGAQISEPYHAPADNCFMICFEQLLIAYFWVRNIGPFLSLKPLRGGSMIFEVGIGDWDKCEIIHWNHKQCFVQSPSAIYSAWLVESATVACLRLFQKNIDLPSVNMYPVVDMRISGQAA